MPNIRLATLEDINELVQMRWDFSEEERTISEVSFEEFRKICSDFLIKSI
jgi:hypothetical protein